MQNVDRYSINICPSEAEQLHKTQYKNRLRNFCFYKIKKKQWTQRHGLQELKQEKKKSFEMLKEQFIQKWKCAVNLLTLKPFKMYMTFFSLVDQ